MIKYLLFILIILSLGCASNSKRMTKQERRANLHLKLGVTHLHAGNYPQALIELLKAEKIEPENPTIQNNLALAYFVRQKHDLSLKHIKKALTLDPKYSDARNNLGRILIDIGQYSEAQRQLKIVLKDLTYTQPAKAQTNLGLSYFKESRFKTAKKYLLKAIQTNREFWI